MNALVDSRALRLRHNAAMDRIGYTSTVDERESLLAAVVWPQPRLLAVSVQAALESLHSDRRGRRVPA